MKSALAVVASSTMSNLEQSKFAFEELQSAYRKLETKQDGLRLALAVAAHGHHPDASTDLKAKAASYLDYAKRYPRRAAVDIEDAEVELAQLRPELNAARERYRTHLETEADRFAQTLIPRHRVAVAAIARALESLSVALAAEGEIQAELSAATPEYPSSSRIPNMAHVFANCRLDYPNSLASAWARVAGKLLDE